MFMWQSLPPSRLLDCLDYCLDRIAKRAGKQQPAREGPSSDGATGQPDRAESGTGEIQSRH